MAQVLSVNVGRPQEIVWQGKSVQTAIWKNPVEGRVRVNRLNLEGDGQADLVGHGGEQRALLVYQMDSYRHWATYLQRPVFKCGAFGENLTVEGLSDEEVCIGDRFRIGSALFEVSQPRVTCYKVGIKLEKREMPALLVAHRRPGFYFRVVEEGDIGAGDIILKVSSAAGALSVADTDALLYSSQHPLERLQQALTMNALSPGWRASFEALLKQARSGGTGNAGLTTVSAKPAWSGYRTLRVLKITHEATTIRSFVLASSADDPLPSWQPGQHVVLRLRPDGATPVIRNYSLCGAPSDARYRIAVKNEGGAASRFLHESIREGDTIEVGAPRGDFILQPNEKPIILLSAGIGSTPVLAMLKASLAAAAVPPREVWWIHSARDRGHHAFAKEVSDLVAGKNHAHVITIYSRPRPKDTTLPEAYATGRLTRALFEQFRVPAQGEFYLCGPMGYLTDLRAMLKAWDVEDARVHFEIFGGAATVNGPPHQPEGPIGTGPLVHFVRSGLSIPWDDRFHNLLELAEASAVPVRWSCRTGVCHNCESGLLAGKIAYALDPLDPPGDDRALICCATPLSEIELDL